MAQRHREINLNEGALWWLTTHNIENPNCFANPFVAHRMEEEYHAHLDLMWS